MIENCLKDIASLLDVNINEMDLGQPMFTDPRYTPVRFHKDNFHEFDPLDRSTPEGSSIERMAFVDGGNLEILRAPNFSVQLVRVYFNIFEHGERVLPKKVPARLEFFVTAFAQVVDGKMYYSAILHPLLDAFTDFLPSGEHMMVDSMDRSLTSEGFRADIGVMGQLTRRAAEWVLAGHVMDKELEKGDLLIRDGTLQTAVSNEKYYSKPAYEAAESRGVLIGGLAKTSTLFTTSGLSLLAAVHKMSKDVGLEKNAWYYNPLAENLHPDHPAEMFVAKLYPGSKYVFRFELYKPQAKALGKDGLGELFLRLGRNSGDWGFIGYPYGLIEADKSARVSFYESDGIRNLVSATLANMDCYDKISRHLQATNAHSVLDAI